MNIREYNFSIPGNTDRHIPGIPGTWPAGSIVTVNEETNQVVKVILGSEDALQLHVSGPVEAREYTGFDQHGNVINDSLVVPISPPALSSQQEEIQHIEQELSNLEQQ